MNIKELESFKLSDVVKFHDELNPKIWYNDKLIPTVRSALIKIADDFVEYLGVDIGDVKDITISGSNSAYTYTEHSDIDLHIIIDMSKLDPDEVYRELFSSKKNLYNESHKITIKSIPVECYVQDSNEDAVSIGEYSVKDNKWIKIPSKRKASLDYKDVKLKYEKLHDVVIHSIKTQDSDIINKLLKKLYRYRQTGLNKGGEFSSENLAYKILRNKGYIEKLYTLRDILRGRELSVENMYR